MDWPTMDRLHPSSVDGRPRTRVIDVVRRRPLAFAGLASLATAVLILGGQGAWHLYAQGQLGRVELINQGPPLTVQVFADADHEPRGEPIDVVTRTSLSLPHGDYRLRVSAPGRLGRDVLLAVNQGEVQTYTLSLDEERLLGTTAIPYSQVTQTLELVPGKAGLIEWTGTTLIRRDGVTGKPVWDALRPAKPWEPGRDPGPWIRKLQGYYWEITLARPAPDLDGDGVGDVVWGLFHPFPTSPHPSATILAISGKDGSLLWSYVAERERPDGEPGQAGKPAATVRSLRLVSAPAMVARGKGPPLLTFVEGTTWVGLDPTSGRQVAGPIDLGFVPIRPVQRADLDGDGEPEILALGSGPAPGRQTLVAFSSRARRPLWSQTINATFDANIVSGATPAWPVVVDLDGDRRSEVVVPDAGMLTPRGDYRGVRLLEGSSGKTRWVRPMRPNTRIDDGLVYVLDVPDLDRDGMRNLLTVSTYWGRDASSSSSAAIAEPEQVFVDALSGKDGRPIWWWKWDLPADQVTRVWAPRLWGRGPDGWPLLAVGLGGDDRTNFPNTKLAPAMAHMLELSTGREVHTIPGLVSRGAADLDGDGLADLWGECAGELRAFRGETPETWRSLGGFVPAGDLDGDGIADAITSLLVAPNRDPSKNTTGTRTAVARSGRDGRVLWKSLLDPWDTGYDQERGEDYWLKTFPLPSGDLDGDGTADVVVSASRVAVGQTRRAATVPIQLLSGRTGQRLWSAGPLPLDFEAHGYPRLDWTGVAAVEPNQVPDVVVKQGSPFVKPGSPPHPHNFFLQDRLARISGRDGRVLWDIALTDQAENREIPFFPPDPVFADLDGDGALDLIAMVVESQGGKNPCILKAVSLRRGQLLWSRPLEPVPLSLLPAFLAVGDLDCDGRSEVVVLQQPLGLLVLSAFDGRDGAIRWTWQHATDKRFVSWDTSMVLADLDGDGKPKVCVNHSDTIRAGRFTIVDGAGRECGSHELTLQSPTTVGVADLDGDGREEVVVKDGARLRAFGNGVKELWSVPCDKEPTRSVRLLQGSKERPGAVMVPPAVGLNGATGQPRWMAQIPWANNAVALPLVPSTSSLPPLLMLRQRGSAMTACRVPHSVDSMGMYAPPRSTAIRAGLYHDDPRWMRPLPWMKWQGYLFGPQRLSSVAALAFLNMVVPLAILRLAARRRPWTVRLLMAVPVAVAVPLTVFLAFEDRMPAFRNTLSLAPGPAFLLGTLAGIPAVAFMAMVGWSFVRTRWRVLSRIAGLTVFASVVIGLVWLWTDRRTTSEMEHYQWSDWYLCVVPGGYAVGVVIVIDRAIRTIGRSLRRPDRRLSRAPFVASEPPR
jgi:hypothetical protein